MSESTGFPLEISPQTEPHEPGLMIVTPLPEPVADRARRMAAAFNERLGVDPKPSESEGELPHVTHLRVLPLGSGISRVGYDEIVAVATGTLHQSAALQPRPLATLGSIEASEDALIARARQNVQPVADLRNWLVSTLTPALGFAPTVKNPNFVHTTLERSTAVHQAIPLADRVRVAEEVGAEFAERPLALTIGSVVLAREPEKYKLQILKEIHFGTR